MKIMKRLFRQPLFFIKKLAGHTGPASKSVKADFILNYILLFFLIGFLSFLSGTFLF